MHSLSKIIFPIASGFAKASFEELSEQIKSSLCLISQNIGCEHACLFRADESATGMQCIAEYNFESNSRKIIGKHFGREQFPWFAEKIEDSGDFYCGRVAGLPDGAKAEKKLLVKRGIKAFALIPLASGKALEGLLLFFSRKNNFRWSAGSRGVIDVYSVLVDTALGKIRMSSELERTARESESLLREVHHRIKNNLQLILSIFQLAAANIKNQKALAIFKSSQDRVKSIAFVHQRLYHSGGASGINFKDYVADLTRDLIRTYRAGKDDVEINVNIQDIYLDSNTAISCGLIINEFVVNSLKYACPNRAKEDKCIINITMYSIKNKYVLDLSDNGPGIPRGVDFNSKNTLGLRLIGNLVKQINGQIRCESKNGASFFILFHT